MAIGPNQEPGWNSIARLFMPPPKRKVVKWTIELEVAEDIPWDVLCDAVQIDKRAKVVSLTVDAQPEYLRVGSNLPQTDEWSHVWRGAAEAQVVNDDPPAEPWTVENSLPQYDLHADKAHYRVDECRECGHACNQHHSLAIPGVVHCQAPEGCACRGTADWEPR